jgi:hypothetical protein
MISVGVTCSARLRGREEPVAERSVHEASWKRAAAKMVIRRPNVSRLSGGEAPVARGGKRHAACRN